MINEVVISSGHAKYVRGAHGYIDEVDEARNVVGKVSSYLEKLGVNVTTYHDNTSKTQAENVNGIVAYHNSKKRDLDISIHFNAASKTNDPRGVEVLYYNQDNLAKKVSASISDVSRLKNRGAKKRTDLGFLKRTDKPAILIEVCFVDSKADVETYKEHFDDICRAISETISGKKLVVAKPAVKVSESKLYKVQVGAYSDNENAEKLAAELKKKGYKPVIV